MKVGNLYPQRRLIEFTLPKRSAYFLPRYTKTLPQLKANGGGKRLTITEPSANYINLFGSTASIYY